MPVYKYEVYSEVIGIGDTLYVEGEGQVLGIQVKVHAIVKVDISPNSKFIWFTGVPAEDLE